MYIKKYGRNSISLGLILVVMSSPVGAVPSILGTYSGTETNTYSCTIADNSGSFSFTDNEIQTISLIIDQQSGNSFSDSGQDTHGTLNYTGTISDTGVVSGSFTGSFTDTITDSTGTTITLNGTESGTFSGTLSGDTLSFSFSGSDKSSAGSSTTTCTFNGTGTITRTATTAINPSTRVDRE